MKKCTKCLANKNESEFSIRIDGRCSTWCKECVRENSRKWYAANTEKSNANRKKYYQENRERELSNRRKKFNENYEINRKRANELAKSPHRRAYSNEYCKAWQKRNRKKVAASILKYKTNNPEKVYAHQAVMWAQRLNILVKPDKCEKCERKVKLQGHHVDYSKPLEVQWLCKICHMHEHEKLLDMNPKENYGDSSSSGK